MGLTVSSNKVINMKMWKRGTLTESQDPSSSPVKELSLSSLSSTFKQITLIHFNDVYNIEPREKEPVGGASRFKTALETLSDKNPMVLFSGDALAPSNMSVVTQGKQMIPVLNTLHINAAVYGNHDFDFGVDHLVDIARETNFPWLMSNVIDKYTGRPLAEGNRYLIQEWESVKIGLIGLVEKEWLATLATLALDDVIYTDYVESANELTPVLKEQGCELIIALTHMRSLNDKRLAESVPDIDLVLGGHDHHYERSEINGILVLKSGSDFRDFSEVTVTFRENDKPQVSVERHTITRDIEENPEVKHIVEEYMELVQDGLEDEIGHIECTLEGRFKCVRTQETNLGNLITDIMRVATRADCALLNSGTFRSDVVHEIGAFKMKDLVAILPMVDPLTVLQISGSQLIEALENGVSQYPKHEGRFPQVSGLTFSFDPRVPSGRRILTNTVMVNGEQLSLEKKYKLCTKGYLADGKDGYHIFKDLSVLIDQEEGPILASIVRNYFTAQSKCNGEMGSTLSIHSALAALASSTDGINPKIEGRIVVCG